MRRRPLRQELSRRGILAEGIEEAIEAGRVLVDGRIVTNPNSQVAPDAALAVRPVRALRGTAKLAAALEAFAVPVEGRVALDLGAAAGGFTTALLQAGARRVYAVDVGHGQLLGSLRQDPRVVNLEATNLADLDAALVPEPVEVATADLSFVSLAQALPQLGLVSFAAGADLVALVKPMFELQLAEPPTDEDGLHRALERARAGVALAGWTVVADMRSPVTGARGAVEFLLHGRRI
jgi:23S rRNA (cytidine1920-2'-O)/16S rRNA (cytidine1409-2'-O)-methyltransferase